MEPLHVAPAASPDGLAETVKFAPAGPAVTLPVGESPSQLLLVQLCSTVCAVTLVLVCAVTVSGCEAAPPPATALNVKSETLNVSCEETPPVTFRVTGAVRTPEA